MKKRWTYLISILALGFVVFNNVVQTAQVIQENRYLINGLIIALIGSTIYGMVNIK